MGSGTARGAAPLRGWLVLALVAVGRVYRALLLTLVTVALLPALGSWTSYVVRTGSMEPSIHVGDVVVARPFGAHEKVPVGRVMIFQAPPGSGVGSVLRVHRVVEALGHDTWTTAGDANPTPDAAPVPRENFRSRAILDVPYVGRPLVWLDDRQYGKLALWLGATALLLLLSFRRIDGEPPAGSGWTARTARHLGVHLRSPRRHRRRSAVTARVVLVLGTVGLTLAVQSTADAAFTARTTMGSNTWKAASALRQAYTTAVLTDSPYAFYRLDEPSGTSAADSAGGNRTGTYASVATYGQTGALPHNAGYAVGLSGTGRMVAGGTGQLDPLTFSAELWFRTTTTSGGKLIGFESSRNATSLGFDREAFMRTDGTVVYMGSATTKNLLVSPTALNNGAWHHLVVTSVPSGTLEQSFMYVDGVLVDSGTTNRAATAYIGWWRVGYGTLPTGKDYPASASFTGSVDDVAVYTTQLTAARVAAHYAAR
jgi:signal peptidase I